jgi:hypothetical protein
MNQKRRERLTFASLDRQMGLPSLPAPTAEEYPLPAWYRAVYNKPLDELAVEDICKACRQKIHLEHIVPRALSLLKTDPFAGEMFDGELLASLKPVPPEYWAKNPAERLALVSLAESVLRHESVTEEVRGDVEELLRKVGYSTP